MRFDHIGIVVASMERGKAHLTTLLGVERWTEAFSDEVNGVHVQFGLDRSGLCYEIIAPYGPNSPVAQVLQTRRGIINHVAYLVEDLAAGAERMQANGCIVAGAAKPAIAYGGRSIQFFVSPLRFIVELVEAPAHRHDVYPQPAETRS